jgi:hypothetical protein
MRQVALSFAFIALALPFFAAAPAQAQAQRTWVSGAGDDASQSAPIFCSRTAPCRTFNAAISATFAGGEVNCLDPGGFNGPTVNISKAITISCEAGTAGIVAPVAMSSGITITAAPTDVVTLRGLDIDGRGIGVNGIGILSAKAVRVEKCTIRNFRVFATSSGLTTFTNNSSTVFLFVSDTVISGNGTGIFLGSLGGFKVASLKNVVITASTGAGLNAFNLNVYANVTKSIISGNGGSAVVTGASSATVNIDRSTIANNAVGLDAAVSGSTIRISGNNIYNNTTGFFIGAGATIQSDSTNNTGGSNGGATVPNASLTKN